MKCIGIISAMWVEAELLFKEMDNVEEYEYAGIKYYKGSLEGCPVVLNVCGVGTINAAIYTQILIDKFGVEAIIHTGIAGSMDPAIKHLSVVVADGLTFHDLEDFQKHKCFPFQEKFVPDQKLSQMVYQCALETLEVSEGLEALEILGTRENSEAFENGQAVENQNPKDEEKTTSCHRGLIISGNAYVTDKNRKVALKERFPEALCVEMEGAGVAHAAFVNGVPFAVVRSISDLADDYANEDYREFEKRAAARAATIVMNVIRKGKNDC